MLWQLICFLEIQIPTRQNKQTIHSQDLLAQDTQKQEAKSRELRPFWPRVVWQMRTWLKSLTWWCSNGNVRKSVTLRLEESSVVFPAIFFYSIFSNVSSASEWSWRSVQCPTPLPPVSSVSTIPEESDFLYCSNSCWRKRTLYTSRLALCLVSGVSWRTDFLRCSGTSGPCNRKCMSCCCFFF